MKKLKYFITSDIHSFYKPLRRSLNNARYNKNAKSHRLVILGDIFDRGKDTLKVYEFIRSIPKERRILVKGNHEELFLSLLDKKLPDDYDYSNGTVSTFLQIAQCGDEDILNRTKLIYDFLDNDAQWLGGDKRAERFGAAAQYADKEVAKRFKDVKKKVIASGIPAWLKSDEWVDYFELGDYVMVHSFIPLRDYTYFPNWRTGATNREWFDARWGCPYTSFDLGRFEEKGKTLVCGHWHAIDFRHHYGEIDGYYDIEEISLYPEKGPLFRTFKHTNESGESIIALDACTVLSDYVNVLKLEM